MRRFLTIGLAFLFLLPAAAAQESMEGPEDYTHLYGHVFSFGRDSGGDRGPSAMNTIYPIGENDFSMGYPTGAIYYEPVGTPEAPLLGDVCMEFGVLVAPPLGFCDPVDGIIDNEIWFFNYNAAMQWSDGLVFEKMGGLDLLTEGKELLKDVQLDPSLPLQAEFWMSADMTPFAQWDKGCAPSSSLCPIKEMMQGSGFEDVKPYYDDLVWPWPLWNADYGIFPKWSILSRVYDVSPEFMATYNTSGAAPAIMDMELNETSAPDDPVRLLTEGVSEPFDMFSLPSTTGYQVVYPMRPAFAPTLVDNIPAGRTLWWMADWHADWSDTVEGLYLLYGTNIAVNSGEFFPPRLSLPMTNPMDIEMVMPQFTDDNKLVIIALFNSPFGAYDVPLDSASFEIIAPDGSVIATQDDDTVTWMQKAAREQQSLLGVSPEAALKRGQATWLWNYLAEKDIKPGDYTIRVTAANQQGKAAFKEAYFTISAGLGKGAVTSSLGGMFTFSKEDIKKLEECHGCHDAETGDLLEGVQNVTMAEAKTMQEAGELGGIGTDDAEAEKKSPGVGLVALLGGLLIFATRRRR